MNTPLTATHCFYERGQSSIIDTANDETPPRGHYSGKTLDQVHVRYSTAEYRLLNEVTHEIDALWIRPPRAATEEEFMYHLEVLPPHDWQHGDNCESFKLSERTCGAITTICARIKEKYYIMADSIFTKHETIIARCAAIDI